MFESATEAVIASGSGDAVTTVEGNAKRIIKYPGKEPQIVADPWVSVADVAALDALSPKADVIVPLAVYQARRTALWSRGIGAGAGRLGVLLAPADEAASVAEDLQHFAVIAIDFPSFTDGRGYSSARLLRERYGYRGELRAVGDVWRDQIFYLSRCGFDAFVIKPGKSIDDALNGFNDFSEVYHSAADQPLPLFRRQQRTAKAAA